MVEPVRRPRDDRTYQSDEQPADPAQSQKGACTSSKAPCIQQPPPQDIAINEAALPPTLPLLAFLLSGCSPSEHTNPNPAGTTTSAAPAGQPGGGSTVGPTNTAPSAALPVAGVTPWQDPLLDEAGIEHIAAEGANALDVYLNKYVRPMALGSRTLSEAVTSPRTPTFSPQYNAVVQDVRQHSLKALNDAKGYFSNMDSQAHSWAPAALESTDAAISAISDGHDVIFIIDSRTEKGRAVWSRLGEYQRAQLATRERNTRVEASKQQRLSAGVSVHVGQIDLDQPRPAGGYPQHESVSVLDIGALMDNRKLAAAQPTKIETAAAMDIRALYIHEVGGHAVAYERHSDRQLRLSGQKPSKAQRRSRFEYEESLVDNMVDKVAYFSDIRNAFTVEFQRRLGSN